MATSLSATVTVARATPTGRRSRVNRIKDVVAVESRPGRSHLRPPGDAQRGESRDPGSQSIVPLTPTAARSVTWALRLCLGRGPQAEAVLNMIVNATH